MDDCVGLGGICAPYGTLDNIIGIGNPVPPSPGGYGSGDLWGNLISGDVYTKRGAYSPGKSKAKKPQSFSMEPRPLIVKK